MSVFDITDDERTGWRARAACYGMDTELFFPDPHGRADEPISVCRTCPVATECLAENLRELHGVFGGMTPGERANLRKGRPRPRRVVGAPYDGSRCGTTVGHARHEAAGEVPCKPCKAAKAARRREVRAAKNRRAA